MANFVPPPNGAGNMMMRVPGGSVAAWKGLMFAPQGRGKAGGPTLFIPDPTPPRSPSGDEVEGVAALHEPVGQVFAGFLGDDSDFWEWAALLIWLGDELRERLSPNIASVLPGDVKRKLKMIKDPRFMALMRKFTFHLNALADNPDYGPPPNSFFNDFINCEHETMAELWGAFVMYGARRIIQEILDTVGPGAAAADASAMRVRAFVQGMTGEAEAVRAFDADHPRPRRRH